MKIDCLGKIGLNMSFKFKENFMLDVYNVGNI